MRKFIIYIIKTDRKESALQTLYLIYRKSLSRQSMFLVIDFKEEMMYDVV